LDDEAEYDFIAKLDETLGFSAAETAELLRECKRYAASVREGSAAQAVPAIARPPRAQTSEPLAGTPLASSQGI